MILTSTLHSDTTGARIFLDTFMKPFVQIYIPSLKGSAQSFTWVTWFSSSPRISVFSISLSENGWGMANKTIPRRSTHAYIYILKLLFLLLSSFNILIWAIALCSHAACKNFAGLFVVRLVLGMCEGSITAGFLIVSAMFYTRNEQTRRVGYWCKSLFFYYFSHLRWCDETDFIGLLVLMNGTGAESTFYCIHHPYRFHAAQIISGFISFGTLHINTDAFKPWQW